MPTQDLRVTVVLDYTATWDDDDEEVDLDYVHDAIMDSFETVDLEFDSEHPLYDEDFNETDKTFTLNLNADNVREVNVEKASS